MIDNEAKKFELLADYFQRIGNRHAQTQMCIRDSLLTMRCPT